MLDRHPVSLPLHPNTDLLHMVEGKKKKRKALQKLDLLLSLTSEKLDKFTGINVYKHVLKPSFKYINNIKGVIIIINVLFIMKY